MPENLEERPKPERWSLAVSLAVIRLNGRLCWQFPTYREEIS
jgi:hypothetical protein